MAGTGRVPKPEEEAGETPAARAAGGLKEEKLPVQAWIVLALAVVLFIVGGMMFVFQVDEAGSNEMWIIGAAVLALGGIGALAYFFDKWGRL